VRSRRFGRLGWTVGEVGYGLWGIGTGPGGWAGADDETGAAALQLAVDLGVNFFDTAWIYGHGHSEALLGELARANPGRGIRVATKVPPKNWVYPSTRSAELEDVFPLDHVLEYTELSLRNLGVDRIDLLQFHVWEDAWAHDERWRRTVDKLKSSGLVEAVGISVNRWESWNGVEAVRTGLIDSVQVVYNIFDQSPEDELFPACRERDVAVIARVPFDEGALTLALTKQETAGQIGMSRHRSGRSGSQHADAGAERAEALRELVSRGVSLPELALRFTLHNDDVNTVISGMRRLKHVHDNIAVGEAPRLPEELLRRLREHRWDRELTEWSR
jgi:aryl-alcohol dehydrogenase-like predicted oxidoreductase